MKKATIPAILVIALILSACTSRQSSPDSVEGEKGRSQEMKMDHTNMSMNATPTPGSMMASGGASPMMEPI